MGSTHVLLDKGVGKFGHVLAEKNFIMINKFKYGQTWKIWPSPLSLSLYNPFKTSVLFVKEFTALVFLRCCSHLSIKALLSSDWWRGNLGT